MTTNAHQSRPLIAITSDLMIRKDRETAYLTMTYAQAVEAAGGIPVILPPTSSDHTTTNETINQLIAHFDGFILSGGDDPVMEHFGTPTHPSVTQILPARQAFETALINQLNNQPDKPVLGICLGMQMLALCRGGTLNQYLPDTHETHSTHWNQPHEITSIDESALPSGVVYSSHKQAVEDAADFRVLATAPDGIIEAFDDPKCAFTLAIQWHPERTDNPALGAELFERLIKACS